MAQYRIRWSPCYPGPDVTTQATLAEVAYRRASVLVSLSIPEISVVQREALLQAIFSWELRAPRKAHLQLCWEHNIANVGRFTITADRGNGNPLAPVYNPNKRIGT